MLLSPGTILGPYRIAALLGAGGMGEVYRARDERLQRDVAIKVIGPDQGGDPDALLRFDREARIVASLSHPHVLAVFDIGRANDLTFIVTELLEGETLRERLARGRLNADAAVRIAVQIAHGLAAAHEKGVVHRDLKPENVMLLEGDHAKVLDFGLAKVSTLSEPVDNDTFQTRSGVMVGTIAYMSPEEIAGGLVDHRADIFAFGAVLYEMMSGRVAFAGRTVGARMSAILTGEPAPVPAGSLPANLVGIIRRCLEKSPDRRFATMREVIAALESRDRGVDPVRSIAVLPFADMSPGRTEDYLCAGIADEIINTLARVPGVRVAARTSAFRFNQTHDLREVGAALNVETVLEGSVRKAGSRLRVSAQLIDPVSGHQLWAARFDRSADDIFALQDEIAAAVRDVLTGASAPGNVAPAPDAAAYDLYLRGRHHLHKRTETGLYKALEHFRSAADRSGSFAASHAALAETFILLAVYGVRPPGEVMPRALEAANRALELNPMLPAAIACRAAVEALYEWRWRDADLEFRRAIEIDPLGAMARHSYAMNCLVPLGRFEEAEVHARQALALDPLSFPVNAALGLLRYFAGAFDLAVPAFVKTIELEPSFGIAHMFLGLTFAEMGRFDQAIEESSAAMRLSAGSPEATAAHGYVLARAGREGEAADALASLEILAASRYVSPALIAQVHAGRGDEGAALRWLEEAVRVRATELAWVDVRPVFDGLRNRPAFHAIRRAIGFDVANATQVRPES